MTAQQLKNSILQMAVQGKLVPQDPNDEPASVLLERIRAEKDAMIKAGKIKKEKNPSVIFRGADNLPYEKNGNNEPVCIADEVPFEIPESWEWVRHNDYFEISGGSQPPKSKFVSEPRPGYVRLYQIRDYGKSPIPVYIPIDSANKISRKGDILLARYGASLGKVFWAEDGAYNVALAKVIPLYNSPLFTHEFLYFYYQSDLYRKIIFGNSRSAQAEFNKEDLSKMWMPVPPIAEQKRIVNKLNCIIPLIEKYAAIEDANDELAKSFPNQLKKSILQLAVQGKLVPQNPDDEPASVLLERIHAEKEHLIKEGKIKRDKHESVIYRRGNSHYEKLDGVERCIDDEIPFEIPESWEWCRLGNISNYDSKKEKINAAEADPTLWELDLEDIEKGGQLLTQKTVGERKSVGDKTIFHTGDILYSKLRPYLLKILIAPADGICTSEIVPFSVYGGIHAEYVVCYLKSPVVDFYINSITYGIKMPRVGTETMTNLLVPIPPIAEQHRIIERLDALLPSLASL